MQVGIISLASRLIIMIIIKRLNPKTGNIMAEEQHDLEAR